MNDYSENLLSKFPKKLDTIFFVCTGSEANDLAYRIAQVYTNSKDVLVMDNAYHGHTSSLIDLSPYKFNRKGGDGKKEYVHIAKMPDGIRGKWLYTDKNWIKKYIQDIKNILKRINKLKIDRDWVTSGNNFSVTGEIIDTTKKDTLYRNIYDPSLFAGTIFRQLLNEHGTTVKQLSRKSQDLTDYKELTVHYSDSLIVSAINLMNESDNLTAELFVKSIGALDTLPGTWEAGLDSIKSFLAEQVKIDTSNIRLADGSGVSRYTLTNSDQLISLLSWVYNSKHKNDFISTLPGGGWPKSTLEKRLIEEGSRVRAKTGGLSGARNLAGYIDSPKYGTVAFSILMNGYIGSSSKHRYVQNQIVKTIIYD